MRASRIGSPMRRIPVASTQQVRAMTKRCASTVNVFAFPRSTTRGQWNSLRPIELRTTESKRFHSTAKGVHALAFVDASAQLGDDVIVGPLAYIGASVRIGDRTVIKSHATVGDEVVLGHDCVINENVTLHNCHAGNRVVLKPGCRIGQDGFGFHPAYTVGKDHVTKKPQTLKVILEDDVEIGANSTVDRGSWRDTRIGAYTKLDNLVQIGHNVNIGRNCLFAAQSGVAGSATVGDRVLVGGQAGIAQYVKVGNDCQIAAKAGVIQDLKAKSKVGGMPAVNIVQFHRNFLITQKRIGSRET